MVTAEMMNAGEYNSPQIERQSIMTRVRRAAAGIAHVGSGILAPFLANNDKADAAPA